MELCNSARCNVTGLVFFVGNVLIRNVPRLGRFKDGVLVRSNVVSGAGISSRTYQIPNIKAEDEGQYRCRAVTLGGKVFSPVSTFVVKGKSASI